MWCQKIPVTQGGEDVPGAVAVLTLARYAPSRYRVAGDPDAHELQEALGTGSTRRGRVERTIEAYLSAIEEEPQVYRFLVHSDEAAPAQSQVRTFTRRLSALLAHGIATEIDASPARAAAWGHGIVGMVQSAGDWWLETGGATRAELVQELTDLLFGAYGTSTS